MRTVVNKTHEPMRVPLGNQRFLRLAPNGRGEIADRAADSRPVRALVEQGRIEIVADDRPRSARPSGAEGRAAATHGHQPPVGVKRRGDR